MKRTLVASIVLNLLAAVPLPVWAQGAGLEWEILHKESIDLYEAAQYDRALVVAKKALESAHKGEADGGLAIAASENMLAVIHEAQSQFELAAR